jgi:hypothetical protein
MLNVQQYLIDNSIQSLIDEFNIKVNQYPEDGLLMLNYDQLKSPKTHPIVMECRSLILNAYNYELVSQKFNRFFNLGETPEYYTDFNWNKCHIMSKEDGSLIGVYLNPNTGSIEISTRSMAKAEQSHDIFGNWRTAILNAFGFKSEEDFQDYWKNGFFSYPGNYTGKTFVFEFISPLNRIVTPYKIDEMVLLSVNNNCNEYSKDDLVCFEKIFQKDKLNIRLPVFYNLPKSPNELIVAVNNLTDLKEGFVLWDEISGKRIKLKSSAYLVAHSIRGETGRPTRKNILNLILTGEDSEFLVYFPEYTDQFNSVRKDVLEFYDILNNTWKDIKHITDQKDFALKIKDTRQSGLYFMAKKNNTDPINAFNSLSTEKQIKFLGE